MVLAGLQKTSLIDFPGMISAVVFVSGCNFTCPYCHNPELARGEYPQRISADELLEFLRNRSTLLDGVVITGGEPTLWPHLPELCRAIKQLKLRVKLDTNGSRPETIRKIIDAEIVDYIAMDIKTDVANYGPPICNQGAVSQVRKSIGIIMEGTVAYEFRTTCAPPFVDETTILRIAREIQNARHYVLQPFKPDNVLNPEYYQSAPPQMPKTQMERLQSLASPWVASCTIRP